MRSSIRRPGRTRTTSAAALYLGSSAEAGCRLRRHPRAAYRRPLRPCNDDPERPGGGGRRVPVDRFRGPLGRALSMRSSMGRRAEPEVAVDRADRVVGGAGATRSYAVPTGGVLGTGRPTSSAPRSERGSIGLVALLRNPPLTVLALAVLFALPRGRAMTRNEMAARPRRCASRRRRSWGQILAAAGRMYVNRPRLFLGIGLSADPARLRRSRSSRHSSSAASACLAVETTGRESAGALVLLVVTVGNDSGAPRAPRSSRRRPRALSSRSTKGRHIGPVRAYRLALAERSVRWSAASRSRSLRRSALTATAFLIPVAIWLVSPLGAARPGGRARGTWAAWAACVAAPSSSAATGSRVGLARRCRRRTRARRRPADRRSADPPDGRASSACSTSCWRRLRPRDAVRRARRRRTSTSTRGCASSSRASRCQRYSLRKSSSRPERRFKF